MSTASDGMTSDQCRRCGRHVGFIGRGIDWVLGCRRRGCRDPKREPTTEAKDETVRSEMPALSPKIRLEGYPLFERERR
jgi:hypothetical protein